MKLDGKTALITGAGRGLGRAIARRLAAEGAGVVLNYSQSREAAESLAREIETAGGLAIALRADVRDAGQIEAMFADVSVRIGGLDILVNNAGARAPGALGAVGLDAYDAAFALNTRSVFLVTQAALPLLRDGGRIINISSISSLLRHPNQSIYAATKAAVDAFTRNWAAELAPRRITVNSVQPGLLETDLAAHIPPDLKALYISRIAFGRIGEPSDITGIVAFLASEDAGWVTGQEIVASGGSYS